MIMILARSRKPFCEFERTASGGAIFPWLRPEMGAGKMRSGVTKSRKTGVAIQKMVLN